MMNESNILTFPIQKCEIDVSQDLRDSVFQLRLEATQMLNDVANGNRELSPENIRGLVRLNKMCRQVGFPTIDIEPYV